MVRVEEKYACYKIAGGRSRAVRNISIAGQDFLPLLSLSLQQQDLSQQADVYVQL